MLKLSKTLHSDGSRSQEQWPDSGQTVASGKTLNSLKRSWQKFFRGHASHSSGSSAGLKAAHLQCHQQCPRLTWILDPSVSCGILWYLVVRHFPMILPLPFLEGNQLNASQHGDKLQLSFGRVDLDFDGLRWFPFSERKLKQVVRLYLAQYTWTRHLSTTTRMKPLTIRTEVFWILHWKPKRIWKLQWNYHPIGHFESPCHWDHNADDLSWSQTSWWKRPWCRPRRGPCCGRTPWRRLEQNNTQRPQVRNGFRTLIWNDLKWHIVTHSDT